MNRNIITRLSLYRSTVYRLKDMGINKVFSDNLGEAIGVTSAQVRKDFSLFGITGNRRGGYVVAELLEGIDSVLGKDSVQNVIITGCGKIGMALMDYPHFDREGIKVVAGFDIDPGKISTKGKIPVLPLSDMKGVIEENKVSTGILAVPEVAAQQLADLMIAAGINGILNFAPLNLRVPENIIVNSVNLVIELENINYFINHPVD
jgi:redox-sensing transcriptional repressor